MSFYNMLFGVNPAAGILLAMLGIDSSFPPRFRDCYIDGDHIVIYTRTGGGNREDYEDENDAMCALPGYVSDADDDFDCTYATFRYTPPEKFRAEFEMLRDMGGSGDPAKAWAGLLDKLNDPGKRDDPEVLATIEKMRPTMDAIAKALLPEATA